jgi:predicted DCC family thiol-disulfide oxidoreductase YuxK
MRLLHSDGTESDVDVVRLLVFGVWAVIFCLDPIQQLAELPVAALNPPGLLMFLPRAAVEFLFLEPVLWSLRVAGVVSCFAAALGVFSPWSIVAAAASVCLVQSLERALGTINHSEIVFVLSAIVLAGFAGADWLTRRGGKRFDAGDGAPLVLMTLAMIFVFSYQFPAINRILTSGLPGILNDSIVHYMVRNTARDTFWVSGGGWYIYESETLRMIARWGFLGTTLVELTLPLGLLLRRGRWFYVAALMLFHVGTFLTMNTVFLQMILVVLLLDISRWAAPRGAVTPPVVFFDGVSGLCAGFIERVFLWDRTGVLRFAPLQGKTAALELTDVDRGSSRNGEPGSIVLEDDGTFYRKSEAVLRIWWRLGGAFRIYAFAAQIIPRVIRDAVYDLVAANRYRIFGRREVCYLPVVAERGLANIQRYPTEMDLTSNEVEAHIELTTESAEGRFLP